MKLVPAILTTAIAACGTSPHRPPAAPNPAPASAAAYADPAASSRSITVVARLVGTGQALPLCGVVHWGSVVDYELVKVEAGTLAGTRFHAAVGCVAMSRASYDTNAGTLDAFRVGETHRLVLSTDPADGRGMSVDATAGPYFIVVRADPS